MKAVGKNIPIIHNYFIEMTLWLFCCCDLPFRSYFHKSLIAQNLKNFRTGRIGRIGIAETGSGI
jgi:hypothetical protein